MTASTGQMVSHYRLSEKIGEGGMGVVWRATDTRLGREVALKTLPESVAGDEERLARFEREARALASLSHPNIAAIFGIEATSGNRLPVLVLEYVPGDSLDECIRRGPLPLDEVLSIAVQLAAGLEAAHELGVIHRDLKPANIKLTPDDRVKILDFGLAKVLATGISGPVDSGATEALVDNPTVTTDQTRAGSFLGTVGYMSPEQARGKAVDKRADIWSFGCVVFEMLTGGSPFPGESIADKIGAILHLEPDWTKLPPSTPVELVELLHRCLEKDPKRRMRDIGDARILLDTLVEGHSRGTAASSASAFVAASRPRRAGLALPVTLGAAALALLLWNVVGPGSFWNRPADTTFGTANLSIAIPPGMRLEGTGLAPNGRAAVFGLTSAADRGKSTGGKLYLRSFDSFELRPLQGTEGSHGGAFSRDGKQIGFAAPVSADSQQLRIASVSVDGNAPPDTVRDWNEEWTYPTPLADGGLFALVHGGTKFLRIPWSNAPPPPPVEIKIDGIDARFQSPTALPPGVNDDLVFVTALYYVPRGFAFGVAALDLKTGRAKLLVEDAGAGHYSTTGHLLFTRGDTLYSVPFDVKQLKLLGTPVARMSGMRTENSWTPAAFDLRGGTLMFRPGGMLGKQRRLVVLDREGKPTPILDDRRAFVYTPAVSPDGRKLAVTVTNPNAIYEIWLTDMANPGLRRVVAIPTADCFNPVFSPDGQRIAYTRMGRSAEDGIYVLSLATGVSEHVLGAKLKQDQPDLTPLSWSPDGRTLLVRLNKARGILARLILPHDGIPAKVEPVKTASDMTVYAAYSPSGRHVAYAASSAGSTNLDVYVAPVDADGSIGPAVLVSTRGGQQPAWSADGRTLYYVEQGRVMSVALNLKNGIEASTPAVAFDLSATTPSKPDSPGVVPLPNGSFVTLQRGEDEVEPTYVNVVLGFDKVLQKM